MELKLAQGEERPPVLWVYVCRHWVAPTGPLLCGYGTPWGMDEQGGAVTIPFPGRRTVLQPAGVAGMLILHRRKKRGRHKFAALSPSLSCTHTNETRKC